MMVHHRANQLIVLTTLIVNTNALLSSRPMLLPVHSNSLSGNSFITRTQQIRGVASHPWIGHKVDLFIKKQKVSQTRGEAFKHVNKGYFCEESPAVNNCQLKQKSVNPLMETKMKIVSPHSIVGTLATGMSLLAMVPHTKPRISKGFIQILDLGIEFPSHMVQLNVCSAMLIFTMLLGQLRFGPTRSETAQSRKRLFDTLSGGMMLNFVLGISNLNGNVVNTGQYQFNVPYVIDAWSWFGRFIIFGFVVNTIATTAALFYGKHGRTMQQSLLQLVLHSQTLTFLLNFRRCYRSVERKMEEHNV